MHESEKVKSLSRVQLLVTHPLDCSPSGSFIHGIFQTRVLEWGAIACEMSAIVHWFEHSLALPFFGIAAHRGFSIAVQGL